MNKLLLALSAVIFLGSLVSCQPSFEVYDLRCEGLTEPLAIDSTQPHFSWKIQSRKPMERVASEIRKAMEQTAYEIEVGPALWKSGKVASADQVMVPYGGAPLAARQQAWWRVRVWDDQGKASAWSPKQRFAIGVLDGLQGDFIGFDPGDGHQPVFRKVFTADHAGKALLHVTSLGYHEVHFNGKKAVDAVLIPPVSQLNKRSLIVTYELDLKRGENEVLIYAGTGWYKSTTFGVAYDGPLVKAELDVDGAPFLRTDGTWEGAWTGRRDLGTWQPHKFGGEWIVASHELTWKPVDVVAVDGLVSTPMMCRPIRVQETLEPVSIEKRTDGTFLVDFGRIVNAMVDLTLAPGTAETTVWATFSDFMHPDGTLETATQSQDVYVTAQGGGHFFNRFNHHLMRYMVLKGISEPPTDLRAYRIGDDIAWKGSFECSDPDLNAIYNLVEASVKNLTFGGYMVDCASIERLGYGGDGNASTQTLQSMADVAPLYLNWLQAWADAQRPDGGLPHTAPNPYTAGGGPYWCSFPVQAAWRTYMNYGDKRPLERFYPVMKHWLDYVDAYTVDGLLQRWPDEPYRGWFLGDWAAPVGVDVKDPASVDLVGNCTMCQVYLALERIAGILGEEADSMAYRERYEALRDRIQSVFYHDGIYASGSQLDLVFPLLAGVVPEELVDQVVAQLRTRTQDLWNGHLATGLVGVPVLTEWATKAREYDWFYSLLKQRDYPGYLYMIDQGATGVWEEWDGGRSHLHNCYNGIGSWFYDALGSIIPLEPGFRRVRIDPQVPEGLDWVKVTRETPYGPITVHRQGNVLQVEVPVGVTAVLP
jgi:alpha-L-rhamnosidase